MSWRLYDNKVVLINNRPTVDEDCCCDCECDDECQYCGGCSLPDDETDCSACAGQCCTPEIIGVTISGIHGIQPCGSCLARDGGGGSIEDLEVTAGPDGFYSLPRGAGSESCYWALALSPGSFSVTGKTHTPSTDCTNTGSGFNYDRTWNILVVRQTAVLWSAHVSTEVPAVGSLLNWHFEGSATADECKTNPTMSNIESSCTWHGPLSLHLRAPNGTITIDICP